MQWNCPHCGSRVSVKDETLGSGWSFSRCHQCNGFALIKKSEISVIRVDKAPPGEKFIQTQSDAQTQTPKTPPAPVIIPASARGTTVKSTPPPSTNTISHARLPNPLPEIPQSKLSTRGVPKTVVAASVLAIVSGSYFYFQLQNVMDGTKVKASATQETIQETPWVSVPPPPQNSPKAPSGPSSNTPQATTEHLITDQIQETSTAPDPVEKSGRLVVQIRPKKASVRNGPGMQYPVTGAVTSDKLYAVTDWNERWFKLQIDNSVGWIRNDLVQSVSDASRITPPNVEPLRN